MAISPLASTSRSPSPFFRPSSRIADVVQVAPYLTHVVRHHGQLTLIPPENAGRIRKSKKKKQRSLTEEGSTECSRSTGIPPQSTSQRSSSTQRNAPTVPAAAVEADGFGNEGLRVLTARSVGGPMQPGVRGSLPVPQSNPAASGSQVSAQNIENEELDIPDVPPPSFEEAISSRPRPRSAAAEPTPGQEDASNTTTLPDIETSAEPDDEPEIDPEQEVTSPTLKRSASDLVARAQWEDDLRSGLSLEERVRRDFLRRLEEETNDLSAAIGDDSSDSSFVGGFSFGIDLPDPESPAVEGAKRLPLTVVNPDSISVLSGHSQISPVVGPYLRPVSGEGMRKTASFPHLVADRPLRRSVISSPNLNIDVAIARRERDLPPLPRSPTCSTASAPAPPPPPAVHAQRPHGPRPLSFHPPHATGQFVDTDMPPLTKGAYTPLLTPNIDKKKTGKTPEATPGDDDDESPLEPWVMVNLSRPVPRPISQVGYLPEVDRGHESESSVTPADSRGSSQHSLALPTAGSNEAVAEARPRNLSSPRHQPNRLSRLFDVLNVPIRPNEGESLSTPVGTGRHLDSAESSTTDIHVHAETHARNTLYNTIQHDSASVTTSPPLSVSQPTPPIDSPPRRPESFFGHSFTLLRSLASPSPPRPPPQPTADEDGPAILGEFREFPAVTPNDSPELPPPPPAAAEKSHRSPSPSTGSAAQSRNLSSGVPRVAQMQAVGSRPVPPPPPRGPPVKHQQPPIPPARGRGGVLKSSAEDGGAGATVAGVKNPQFRSIRRKPPPPPPPPEELKPSRAIGVSVLDSPAREWDQRDESPTLRSTLMAILDVPVASGEVEQLDELLSSSSLDSSSSVDSSVTPDNISIHTDADVDLGDAPMEFWPTGDIKVSPSPVASAQPGRPLPPIPVRVQGTISRPAPPPPPRMSAVPKRRVGLHLVSPPTSPMLPPVMELDRSRERIAFPVPMPAIPQSPAQSLSNVTVSHSPQAEREVGLPSPWEQRQSPRGAVDLTRLAHVGDRSAGEHTEAVESPVEGGSSTTPGVTTQSSSLSPPPPTFMGYTDLDVLLSRLEEGATSPDGISYDDLLTISDILGPGDVSQTAPNSVMEAIPVGKVEMQRRRVTKDGRVKLKLSLLGVVVDKCGICLSQFKMDDWACVVPCQHAFHERCLRSWLIRSTTCPLCRNSLNSPV